ncbi:hypothetical protein RDABS01_032739, partial [Bienertia sinuspersici]
MSPKGAPQPLIPFMTPSPLTPFTNILASQGANDDLQQICKVWASKFTEGSCLVKSVSYDVSEAARIISSNLGDLNNK